MGTYANRYAGRAELEAQIASLQTQLAALPARPIEPDYRGRGELVAVSFTLGMGEPHRRSPYTFVALRVKGKWYVTGANGPNGVTWRALWEWIESLGGLATGSEVNRASAWSELDY